MCSVATPCFANLFLFYYEWLYINNPKKENVVPTQTFCYTLRFVDGLSTINNEKF